MSDQVETFELSSLDLDLTGVDISRKLLPRQQKLCRIGDPKIEKAAGKAKQLIVPLVLEEAATDTNGETINPGFVVTDRIIVEPTGGLTEKMIKERLARLQCAVLKVKVPEGKFQAADLPGKLVRVTFDVRTDKTDSSKQYQEIKRYDSE